MDFIIYTRTSAQASQDEKDAFVELVTSGGAVDGQYVRDGINREGASMVFLKCDEEIIGVAALKVPSEKYRCGLGKEAKSGHPVPKEEYPFELGYVAVSKGHEGKGLGRLLAQMVVRLADGKNLFATTSNPAMLCSVLPNLGFKWVGKTWKSKTNDKAIQAADLHLMILVPFKS